jgi:hypothetical protein
MTVHVLNRREPLMDEPPQPQAVYVEEGGGGNVQFYDGGRGELFL